MKVSDLIAQYLKKVGVKCVFGYQGGSITHIVDSISQCNGLSYIQNLHEQGSAFSADAYARVSDEGIGVAIGTNGPGATNLVTGIADAYCDSVPVLFITGQVHTWAIKKNSNYRQNSFQEIDIISIVRPITKYAVTVTDAKDVIPCLQEAIEIAKSGRKGPVVVDIPVDIQGEDIDFLIENYECSLNDSLFSIENKSKIIKQINDAKDIIANCKRPVVLCGGGVSQVAKQDLEVFTGKHNIPVVCSLMGLDRFQHNLKQFIGFIGTYGNRYANIAVQKSDVLIILGSRLDQRQTGKNTKEFAPSSVIIHVDIDPLELSHSIKEDLNINCDCDVFLKLLKEEMVDFELDFSDWLNEVRQIKELYQEENEIVNDGVNPVCFFKKLSSILPDETIVCSDVGQNQMWVAQGLRFKKKNFRILNSGGLGAMGYSLPASMGAYYAQKHKKIIAIMGDGGLQMNVQELNCIGKKALPITIIVMNNQTLGMIRDIQKKYYHNNYVGTEDGYMTAPIEGLAKAYGLEYLLIDYGETYEELSEIINSKKPTIIEVKMPQNTCVAPELVGMNSIDMQNPIK